MNKDCEASEQVVIRNVFLNAVGLKHKEVKLLILVVLLIDATQPIHCSPSPWLNKPQKDQFCSCHHQNMGDMSEKVPSNENMSVLSQIIRS